MQSMKIGSDMIHYEIENGTVLNVESHNETEVSGYSGGHVINGTIQSGVSRSRTVLCQDIYLRDAAGRQFAASLKDWNLSAMQGHELVLIKTRSNYHSGYGMIYNKTLDIIYTGVLENFFRLENETDRRGRLLFAAVAAIGLPILTYSVTKSEDVGAGAAIVAVVFMIFALRRNATGRSMGVTLPREMKRKLEDLLTLQ